MLNRVLDVVQRLENAMKKRRDFRSFRPRWTLAHMQGAHSRSSTSGPT